jgi:hypothetical protein
MMEIKIFSDFLSLIEGIAKDVATLAKLPERERKRHMAVLDETLVLLDSALLLIINRLGDIMHEAEREPPNAFAEELGKLSNTQEWMRIERDVRLCSNLRAAGRELNSLAGRLSGRVSLKDQSSFNTLIWQVLEGEGRLADFVSHSLSSLAAMADSAAQSAEEFDKAYSLVRRTRDALLSERRRLVSMQVEAFKFL